MFLRPPRPKRPATPFPYPTPLRSQRRERRGVEAAIGLDLGDDRADVLRGDAVHLLDRAIKQKPADEDVQFARHAFAIVEDFLERVGAETGVARPADLAETVENIGFDLLGLHRVEVVRRDHALAQLFERRRVEERLAKLDRKSTRLNS